VEWTLPTGIKYVSKRTIVILLPFDKKVGPTTKLTNE